MWSLLSGVLLVLHWTHSIVAEGSTNDFGAWQTTLVPSEEFPEANTQPLFAETTPSVTTPDVTFEEHTTTEATTDFSSVTDSFLDASYDVVLPNAHLYDIYCRPELCIRYNRLGELVTKKHVACGFNGTFADVCPPGRMILRTDTELRKLILDLHNEARDRLASGVEKGAQFASASRMPTVVWDDELANLAEINVRSCKFEHDECRSTETFLHAGQNLATGSYYLETDILEIIRNLTTLWYNEYIDTTQHVLDRYTTEYNATIGHYTQMISDRTTTLGCGIVIYPNKMDGFVFKSVLYACNYAITSIVDQPVYLKGESASRCVTGTNPAFPHLCNVEENYLIKAIPAYV